MQRIIMYPKDVITVNGKTERQARYLLNKIRILLNKERHQSVTIEEFCNYMGLRIEKVMEQLK